MPFKPGNSDNLNGAPIKELRPSEWVKKELKALTSLDINTKAGYEESISHVEHIAKTLVKGASTISDPKIRLEYIKEVIDRVEGKPSQPIDHTSGGERIFSNMTDEQLRHLFQG